mgnify:CR=1 FL=1
MTKPLGRLKGLNVMPEEVLNKRPRNQSIVATKTPKEPISQLGSIVPHSAHAEKRSREYHKAIKATHTGGRESSARITDQLNPDRSVSMANKRGRSFPGLAN